MSCTAVPQANPTETPFPTPAAILIALTPTSGVHFTATPSIIPEPTKWARWMDYENALAAVFLPLPYLPGKGLCEWQILGQSNLLVYVWAICQIANPGGAAMSAPAVVHLGPDDTIQEIEIPGDGSNYPVDIRRLFPVELQEMIFTQAADIDKMWAHIQVRQDNPEPPLIALSGISLP